MGHRTSCEVSTCHMYIMKMFSSNKETKTLKNCVIVKCELPKCPMLILLFNLMFACLTPMYTPRSRWDGRCILSKFQIVACHGVLYYSRDFPGRSSKKIAFEGRVHCVGWKTPHVVQIIFINIWKASLEPLLSISIKMCNYPGNI